MRARVPGFNNEDETPPTFTSSSGGDGGTEKNDHVYVFLNFISNLQ